ncbi:DUF397 domain-containing protein [Streptomyces albus]|uniref:DUF397 domain-containing protein n=1 Tax=Streptomyces albus TaxID=1888 RepID=UPI0004C8ED99|nr:DUF397 domain-containing protein [Streptomyces albus]
MNSGKAELPWFKSSYSGTQGDSCVEVAIAEQGVHVRDSKDVTIPAFMVGREEWASFLGFVSER